MITVALVLYHSQTIITEEAKSREIYRTEQFKNFKTKSILFFQNQQEEIIRQKLN